MKLLRIDDYGEHMKYHSIGWKSSLDKNKVRNQLFVKDTKGGIRVLTLKAALPDWYVPDIRIVSDDTLFPEQVCVKINPCRLLPPPCWANKEEFEKEKSALAVFFPWKSEYIKTHDEASYLVKEDDRNLKEKINFLNETLGKETKKVGIDEIKNGELGVRDHYLHEKWSRQTGIDLDCMNSHRSLYAVWLIKNTGTPALVYNDNEKQKYKTVQRPVFGDKPEENPQFLLGCSRVKYVAEFSDKAKSLAFLTDFEIRDELLSEEIEEVKQMANSANKPIITFANNFKSVQMPDGSQLSCSKSQPNFLKILHSSNDPVDWESLREELGISSDSPERYISGQRSKSKSSKAVQKERAMKTLIKILKSVECNINKHYLSLNRDKYTFISQ